RHRTGPKPKDHGAFDTRVQRGASWGGCVSVATVGTDMIGFEDVRAAAERVRGVAHVTPVLTSRTLDERTGASVFLKAENLQRGGAFKFRGAYNRISTLPSERLQRGVVAFSSGNHAQGVALAARMLGSPA